MPITPVKSNENGLNSFMIAVPIDRANDMPIKIKTFILSPFAIILERVLPLPNCCYLNSETTYKAIVPMNVSQLPADFTLLAVSITNHEANDTNTIGIIVIAIPTIDNKPKKTSKNFIISISPFFRFCISFDTS